MSTSKVRWSDLLLTQHSLSYIAVIVICLIMSSVLGAFVPGQISMLSENYGSQNAFYRTIYNLLIIFIGTYLVRFLYEFILNKYLVLLIQNMRSKCYTSWILSYDMKTEKLSNRELYPLGEVMARIMSDSESLRELATSGAFGLVIDLFFVVSCLGALISLNGETGSILAIAEGIAVFLLVYGSRYMRLIFHQVRKARGLVSRAIANVLGGVEDSYFLDHGNYASKKGKESFDDFLLKQLKSNIWDASYFSLAESLYPLLLALIVFVAPNSHIAGAALIFAIVDLIQRSIGPIKNVAGKVANIQRAITGMNRISEFVGDLERGHSSPLESDTVDVIELDYMSVDIDKFSYGDEKKFALENINFTAKAGELIGIVGLSGSGKSTLLNIIAANIVPKQGQITLSDHIGRKLNFPGESTEDIVDYRMQVGIVSQDSHIFSESLLFNITLSNEMCERFDVFWSWVCKEIPYLASWGITPEEIIVPKDLSLGQKQLLSAVRACYLRKSIVLFDEVSSALDSELELALRKAVLLIQQNSLTIIVAHRIETIFGADKIVVMDEGRVVDIDTHGALLLNSPLYQKFIQMMSRAN